MSTASDPTDPAPEHPEVSGPADEPPARSLRTKRPWIALAVVCLVLDLVTKWVVFYPHVTMDTFREGMLVGSVCPGWDTILVYNRGITFGMFPGAGPWVLAIGTGVVILVLCRKLWTTEASRKLELFALSIVIGGAIGNLYDRTLRPLVEPDTNSGVRDFLDWYVPADTSLGGWLIETFGTNHWYTSNVADVLIVCGVILLAWCILREPAPAPAEDAKKSDAPTSETARA